MYNKSKTYSHLKAFTFNLTLNLTNRSNNATLRPKRYNLPIPLSPKPREAPTVQRSLRRAIGFPDSEVLQNESEIRRRNYQEYSEARPEVRARVF